MDEETKAAFADVSAAFGTINTVLGDIIAGMATAEHLDAVLGKMDGMATKADLDALEARLMTRMNDGFERVLRKQGVLQANDDALSLRVTQLEEDVRQLRGGI